MNRKEKILQWIIGLSGILCLYVFLSTRSLTLMNFILSEKMDTELQEFTKYGDLYYYNCINHFKVDMPEQLRRFRLSDRNSPMNKAQILTFGDSFFDVSFQKTLPERILDSLHVNLYSYMTQDPYRANPFCTLQDSDYAFQDSGKYLIYESVERNIPVKFSKPYAPACNDYPEIKTGWFIEVLKNYIFKSKQDALYDLMLKRSLLSHRIYSFISTLKFDLFGYISKMTPVYTVKPEPWLYYYNQFKNEPGGFSYNYSDHEINTYCDNIAQLAKDLKTRYNLILIFMPVPNKYSIYCRFYKDKRYNNFIPRLQQGLKSRRVNYINLYDNFAISSDTLYYGTDTHWNKRGVDMALDLTVKLMQTDSILIYQ